MGDQLCENLRQSYNQMGICSSDEEFWNLDDDMARAGDGLGCSEGMDMEDSLFEVTGPECGDTHYDSKYHDGKSTSGALDSPTETPDVGELASWISTDTKSEDVTRSQAGLAADPGGTGLVVGAEAPYPVIEDAASCKRGSAVDDKRAAKVAKVESYKANKVNRGRAEAQVTGSSSVLTPQQLNSRRQNKRRASLRAAERATWLSSGPQAEGRGPATAKGKKTVTEGVGRLFGAVADFWEAKKRRLDSGLASERATSCTGEK